MNLGTEKAITSLYWILLFQYLAIQQQFQLIQLTEIKKMC